MKIIFYGARQAGLISLLTLLSKGEQVVCLIPDDEIVKEAGEGLGLNVKKFDNINDKEVVGYLKGLRPDLFICCHGRQILKKDILSFGCINLHPCLYKYKGANPVENMLKHGEKKASVGIHWMTEKIDKGEVIVEEFKEVESRTTVGVYNELYPLYSKVLIRALDKINNRKL